MFKRLVIVGAGGHGKVVADMALKLGYTNILFADDNATGECMGFPIICKSTDFEHQNDGKTDFVIAVGNNAIRKKIAESHDANWVTLIHPSAQIDTNVKIGRGTVINNINICSNCRIGAEAVVVKDIFAGGGYTSVYLHTSKHSRKQAVYAAGRTVA